MCTLENSSDIIDLSSDEAGEIEIVDWPVPIGGSKTENNNFEFIDDIYLKDIIQKCLMAENSQGMLRVINRSLLPLYREAKPEYLNSIEFQQLLQKNSFMIEKKPKFKFSFLKLVCETLKRNKNKKRLSFITLNNDLKRNKVNNDHNREKGNINVIDVDSIGDCGHKNDVILLDEIVNEEKENQSNSLVLQLEHDPAPYTPPVVLSQTIVDTSVVIEEEKLNAFNFGQKLTCDKSTSWQCLNNSSDDLLIAQRIEVPIDENVKERIDLIKFEIRELKKRIEELEETEVNEDNPNSPYVVCETYKEKVVGLYKELCKLTQLPLVKKHEVRLSVLEGHSEAPVKILQKFLNNNIQSNGYPLFPDFNDVKICVVLANDIYKLQWDSSKVMKEARSLFTQCGRALQKLRQGREWKDLMAKVKKDCDDDPALHDTELMAKLEANKQHAIKREVDIIEKYVRLESEGVQKRRKNPQLDTHDNSSDSDADSVIIDEEDMVKNEEFFKKLRETVKIEKTDNENDAYNETKAVKEECIVKMEPLSKQLEDLGDNFTITIEVDNPFLIVDVSSDSDDEVV